MFKEDANITWENVADQLYQQLIDLDNKAIIMKVELQPLEHSLSVFRDMLSIQENPSSELLKKSWELEKLFKSLYSKVRAQQIG